jgi:RNA polymerase sigma factor (sigma-70 family)
MSLKEFQHQVIPIKDKLFRLALRIMGNGQEAEDIVQEVFIKLWNTRNELAQIANIEAWSMRITKNLAIDKLRSKNRQTIELPLSLNNQQDPDNPHTLTEYRDTVAQIQHLMDELPKKQRMVMQLRDIEGLTYQEIAESLDLPLNQVRVYLHRARQTIRGRILKLNLLK